MRMNLNLGFYAASCNHDTLMLRADNIRKLLLNNNLLINSSKTMLLYIYISNFICPDIIFNNLLITPSSKISLNIRVLYYLKMTTCATYFASIITLRSHNQLYLETS